MFQILGKALGFLSIKDSLPFMSRYYHVKLISELKNGFPHLVVAIESLTQASIFSLPQLASSLLDSVAEAQRVQVSTRQTAVA